MGKQRLKKLATLFSHGLQPCGLSFDFCNSMSDGPAYRTSRQTFDAAASATGRSSSARVERIEFRNQVGRRRCCRHALFRN